ncbi:MAG: hypothetical protein ACQETL_18610 [Bacteroidota bacterium]
MKNNYLALAGIGTALASVLHIAIILGGPDWYRFFGAGEGMAQLAENGSNYPIIATSIIVLILAIWSLYAFSGAGFIQKLPLLKPILIIISIIFIVRGLFGIPLVIILDHPYLNELEAKMIFMMISSIISLLLAWFYLKGVIKLNTKNE